MHLRDYILEKLNTPKAEEPAQVEAQVEETEETNEETEAEIVEGEESIKDEKSFRAAAEAKFKKVFADELDEKKMNEIIDGILSKYKDDADKGEWGKLIGILNKSF